MIRKIDYDNLDRLKNDKLLNKFTTSYQYVTKGNNNSDLIKTINNKYLNQKYEYDTQFDLEKPREKMKVNNIIQKDETNKSSFCISVDGTIKYWKSQTKNI